MAILYGKLCASGDRVHQVIAYVTSVEMFYGLFEGAKAGERVVSRRAKNENSRQLIGLARHGGC